MVNTSPLAPRPDTKETVPKTPPKLAISETPVVSVHAWSTLKFDQSEELRSQVPMPPLPLVPRWEGSQPRVAAKTGEERAHTVNPAKSLECLRRKVLE